MKTFKQFYAEAYQLDEFVNPKDIKSTLSKVKSAVTNNPITRTATRIASNPIVRTGGRIVGAGLNLHYNRGMGLDKATQSNDPRIGPIERTLGGISAVSPPGMSQATGIAHNIIGLSPTLQRVDRRIGKEHEKAYKANPAGYTQMLGRSF